jgi:hypothetical protein
MRGFAFAFFIWLMAARPLLGEINQEPLVLDLYAPRTEIRAVLLKHTPIGSSMKEVVKFISTQLRHSGDISKAQRAPTPSRPHAVKTIDLNLGEYYQHLGAVFLTAPMIVRREVDAQWWFNRDDQLIDSSVNKRTSVY